MVNLIHKIVGFKTKDLYLGELVKIEKEFSHTQGTCIDLVTGCEVPNRVYNVKCYGFEPPKYIVCKKKKDVMEEYKDIFTGSIYESLDPFIKNHDIRIVNLEPITSNKKRITYKYAQEVLERKNTLCFKK